MRILVISDTHIPANKSKLPAVIEEEAKMCDCCLHCGDFIAYSVYKTLNSWIKTYGVCGNMDNGEIYRKLPSKQIIKLEEVTLGLTHGRGHPNNLINYINHEFSQEFKEIDIFAFGHSHYPLNKEIEGKIYFNPGSSTDKISVPHCSYGILEITGKKIKRRLVKIE